MTRRDAMTWAARLAENEATNAARAARAIETAKAIEAARADDDVQLACEPWLYP